MQRPAKTPWQRKWLNLDCYCDKIQEMATQAEAFCGRWFKNNTDKALLVIVGDPNSGKTHAAAAIFRFCLAAGLKSFETKVWDQGGHIPSATFASWPEVADEFKNGDYGRVQDLMESDLVILDDLGAEYDPSKNAANKLCQILSRRERRFTVVTTNIGPMEWPAKFDVRIADRLLRNSTVVNLTGLKSYTMETSTVQPSSSF